MEIPGTKLTLELMEYYEPVTTDAKHREDVNKITFIHMLGMRLLLRRTTNIQRLREN